MFISGKDLSLCGRRTTQGTFAVKGDELWQRTLSLIMVSAPCSSDNGVHVVIKHQIIPVSIVNQLIFAELCRASLKPGEQVLSMSLRQ